MAFDTFNLHNLQFTQQSNKRLTSTTSLDGDTECRRAFKFEKTILCLLVIGIFVLTPAVAMSWSIFGGSGTKMGFANTVIRYADRDYEGAKWIEAKNVASVNRAANGKFGPLYAIDGVDGQNYWIADKKGKIFKVKDGHWQFMGWPKGCIKPRIAALDGDTAFITGQQSRRNNWGNKLVMVAPKGTRAFDIAYATRAWPTILSRDYVFLAVSDGRTRPHAYRYIGGDLKELTPDKEISALVHREDNTPLSNFHSGYLIESAVFKEKETAYALWASNYARSVKPMIVQFKQGLWVTVERLNASFNTKRDHSSWFGQDQKGVFVVVTGGGGRVVLHQIGGNTWEQNVMKSGTTTSCDMIAVWGVSPEKYWVMDNNGSIWERVDNQWRRVVQGLYKENIQFNAAWVTPEGSILALTKNSLYQLD